MKYVCFATEEGPLWVWADDISAVFTERLLGNVKKTVIQVFGKTYHIEEDLELALGSIERWRSEVKR